MKRKQTSVCSPMVNTLKGMNGLQRVAFSFIHVLLCFERWISPRGHMREWLRRNALLGTFLFIPALIVMPAIGLMLWQVDGWMSLLMSMATTLVSHPLQTLVLLIVIRIVIASFRR